MDGTGSFAGSKGASAKAKSRYMRTREERDADNEEVIMQRDRLRVHEMDRKAVFEQTQAEAQQQRTQITLLKRETKELRSLQMQVSKGQNTSSEAFQRRQTDMIRTRMAMLRRKVDELRQSNEDRTAKLAGLNGKIEVVEMEAAPVLDETSPLTQKIRTLENRLDKSLIKHNEALAIRRTYESIVKRLGQERVGFDNQLAAIEKTLKAKEHDFLELKNMEHDAHHAKEIAKAEVQQFRAAFTAERKQKNRELEERTLYVKAKMDAVQAAELEAQRAAAETKALEARAEEEEQRRVAGQQPTTAELRSEDDEKRLLKYAETYRAIKDATRASSADEVVAKIKAQAETADSLKQMKEDAVARVKVLSERKADLRRRVEDAKYSGTGQLGSRRVVDEFAAHLTEAKAALEAATADYEGVSKLFAATKGGIEHLTQQLAGYKAEDGGKRQPVDEGAMVEALQHVDNRLCGLLEEVTTAAGGDDLAVLLPPADREVQPLPPRHNLRVTFAAEAEEEADAGRAAAAREAAAGDDADDDPHDRIALKEMSASAVDRETKKQRKRGRRKDDDN